MTEERLSPFLQHSPYPVVWDEFSRCQACGTFTRCCRYFAGFACGQFAELCEDCLGLDDEEIARRLPKARRDGAQP